VYPDDVGKLIKAGTKIDMNIHQHSFGEEIKAGVSVAFKFYPKGVTRSMWRLRCTPQTPRRDRYSGRHRRPRRWL
jgi:hypothetical protein